MPKFKSASTAVLLLALLGCTAAPLSSPSPVPLPSVPATPSPAAPVPTAQPPAPTAAPATATPLPATDPPDPGADSASVSIVDFSFDPAALEVATGTEVTWTNTGAAPHTVTFDDDGPNSGVLESGQTYQQSFDTAGTFSYICAIHPAMTGTITVSD